MNLYFRWGLGLGTGTCQYQNTPCGSSGSWSNMSLLTGDWTHCSYFWSRFIFTQWQTEMCMLCHLHNKLFYVHANVALAELVMHVLEISTKKTLFLKIDFFFSLSHWEPPIVLLFYSPRRKKSPWLDKINMSAVSLTPLHPLKALALLKMTTALHLPLCLFHYNEHVCHPKRRSIWGQSAPHPQGTLVDGLTLSLTWSWRPVGTARLSTHRPYVSNQSVSLALNGTLAIPASQAGHVSFLSPLTAKPSPCNWLLFYKAWMLIWLHNEWKHLTLSGPACTPGIYSELSFSIGEQILISTLFWKRCSFSECVIAPCSFHL